MQTKNISAFEQRCPSFWAVAMSGRMGKSEHVRENLTAATTMYRDVDMDFYLEQEVR